jgi:hypothetical protein
VLNLLFMNLLYLFKGLKSKRWYTNFMLLTLGTLYTDI